MDPIRIRDTILQTVSVGDQPHEHPSISGLMSCLRRQYYEIATDHGEGPGKNDLAKHNPWELRDGDLHEADLKRWMAKAGYQFTNQRGMDDRVRQDTVHLDVGGGVLIPGHVDGGVSGPGLDGEGLFEAKSMSAYRFVSTVKLGVKEAQPEYYGQINGYMRAKSYDWTLFVAKAKDSSATRRQIDSLNKKRESEGLHAVSDKLYVEVIPYDPPMAHLVVQRGRLILKYWSTKRLPPREKRLGKDWECDWCVFRDACWAGTPELEKTRAKGS